MQVAPLAGAWIEIVFTSGSPLMDVVAPLAGAWIEIVYAGTTGFDSAGRSPRGSVD